MNPAITVQLAAEPASIDAARVDDLRLRVTVHNVGRDTVDPELRLSELRVDGAPSQAWSMAVMNSGQPTQWRALPPGERATAEWALGRDLFPQPGTYHLELVVSGVAAPPLDVTITP